MRPLFILTALLLCSCTYKPQQQNIETSNGTSDTFNVGTKLFVWKDSTRDDPYYGRKRIINVKVWYPTDANIRAEDYPLSPYFYRIQEAYKSLPYWSEEDLALALSIETNSLVKAPIAKSAATFPLLIFSPSLGANLSAFSFYAEQLAQEGYIVAGVNHLYESEYVFDEEGRLFLNNVAFHDSLKTLEIPEQITAEEYRAVKGLRQKVLGEDLMFCLNQLTKLNATEFSSQINLSRVGAYGHSIGGAAAVYAAYLDPRFKAVLNLDGTPPSVALEEGIQQPFMFIEDLTDYKNHEGYAKMHQRRSDFCNKVGGDAYRILLAGINHNSFLDSHYYTAESEEEKASALKVLVQTEYYMQQFFDQYLQGETSEIKATTTEALEILTFK